MVGGRGKRERGNEAIKVANTNLQLVLGVMQTVAYFPFITNHTRMATHNTAQFTISGLRIEDAFGRAIEE